MGNNKTRTVKLTEDQFNNVIRALGIAENAFIDMRNDYIKKLCRLRGVDEVTRLAKKETNDMFQTACDFCDLLLSLKSGELDV